jgi:hypothetical protein
MPEEPIKKLLRETPFSFLGTVQHLGAATLTDLPVDDHTAVVHVDYVLHAPPAFARLEGYQITLQLRAGDVPQVGETAAFFAQGLAFGEGIALTEVGRLAVEDVEPYITRALEAGTGASPLADVVHEVEQEDRREHMLAADAVVTARVIKIEKAGPVSPSEHDPDWWRASMEVQHLERGTAAEGVIDVLFANSRDVRWYHVPKPSPSQEGLWILHATAEELRDLAPYMLLHPVDYQPAQELDLLRRPGG